MLIQPQPDDPHADRDPAGTAHDGVLRPYAKPHIWTCTNEQLLTILGPARTGGASDPFGPLAPGFDPNMHPWDESPRFRMPDTH